jgi:Fic family protein
VKYALPHLKIYSLHKASISLGNIERGRHINTVMYVKENGSINNSKYQDINNIGKTTATEDLHKLVKMGLLAEPTAKGRGAKYELKN